MKNLFLDILGEKKLLEETLMINNPLVSVIITSYNRLAYLEEAIKSIINQTYKNIEIIIVDDFSDLKTRNFLKDYDSKYENIRLILNKSNRGSAYSWNRGVYISKGQYIARMDSDDISEPNRIEEQLRFLKYNPDVFACGTYSNLIDKDGKKKREIKMEWVMDKIKKNMSLTNPVINSTSMFNINSAKKKNLYLHKLFFPADDYYSWMRIFYNKNIITNLPKYLFNYRQHNSLSHQLSIKQGLMTLLINKLFELNKHINIFNQNKDKFKIYLDLYVQNQSLINLLNILNLYFYEEKDIKILRSVLSKKSEISFFKNFIKNILKDLILIKFKFIKLLGRERIRFDIRKIILKNDYIDFKALPSIARPSNVEIFYFENNLIDNLFKKNSVRLYFYHLLAIRKFKDIFYMFLVTRKILQKIINR